jgi:hypothetical protein
MYECFENNIRAVSGKKRKRRNDESIPIPRNDESVPILRNDESIPIPR